MHMPVTLIISTFCILMVFQAPGPNAMTFLICLRDMSEHVTMAKKTKDFQGHKTNKHSFSVFSAKYEYARNMLKYIQTTAQYLYDYKIANVHKNLQTPNHNIMNTINFYRL